MQLFFTVASRGGAVLLLAGILLAAYKNRLNKNLGVAGASLKISKIKYAAAGVYYCLLISILLYSLCLVYEVGTISMGGNFNATDLFKVHPLLRILGKVAGIILAASVFASHRESVSYLRKHSSLVIETAYYATRSSELVHAGQIKEGRELLLKACQLTGDSAELWARLGFLCETIGDSKEADTYLDKAMVITETKKGIDAKEIAKYEELFGVILHHRGKKEEGLKHIKRAEELDPSGGHVAKCEKHFERFSDIAKA